MLKVTVEAVQGDKKNKVEANSKEEEVVETMMLLSLTQTTLIHWYCNLKIFGLLNFMLLGVDIANSLSLNTNLLPGNLKARSNLEKLMLMNRKTKD